ncbi:MAG: hypothetical protein ABSF45_04155 [Terriglobia bacterium]|jgi:hypothetical protein
MSRLILVIMAIGVAGGTLRAQGALSPHQYMLEGVVTHHGNTGAVSADYGIPLYQAVTAIGQEYGWAIQYEDPPFSGKHDLIDLTNPAYRSAHPGTEVRLGPAGGPFKSTYPESPSMWTSPRMEPEVLEKVVSDYNQSGNPGHFTVRGLSDGTFDVIGDGLHDDSGADVPSQPVLDTRITVPLATRNGNDALQAVLDTLSSRIGIKMYVYQAPDHELSLVSTKVGGANVPARDLLMQIVNCLSRPHVWVFHYIPQPRQYVLGIFPVARAEYGGFGQKRLIPVGPPRITSPAGP